MPNTDINKKFVSFGNITLILAILEIIFLMFLIFYILGVLFMGILIIIVLIVITIFRFFAVGSLKKANRLLNNYRLDQFLNKIISCSILFLIGNIIFVVGRNEFAAWVARDEQNVPQYAVLIFTFIISIILMFISGLIEYQAWDRLHMFFEQDQSSFSPTIAKTGRNGASLLKSGGLLNIFIVLIVVGSILRIVGFLILLSLKKLGDEPPLTVAQVTVAQVTPATRPPPAAVEPSKRFCPNCGSPVPGTEKFCGACGSEIS